MKRWKRWTTGSVLLVAAVAGMWWGTITYLFHHRNRALVDDLIERGVMSKDFPLEELLDDRVLDRDNFVENPGEALRRLKEKRNDEFPGEEQ
jgi:hypothetical protein